MLIFNANIIRLANKKNLMIISKAQGFVEIDLYACKIKLKNYILNIPTIVC